MEKTYLTALPNETSVLIRAGVEPEAFANIYDHYYKQIFNYMRYRIENAEVADELTSQVFELVLKKFNTYCPQKAPFAVWIFAIARNVVNDHYRRSKKNKAWLPLEFISRYSSPQPGPEETTVQNEDRDRLSNALASLEERERDIVALKFNAGLKNRSIAEMTGISESNVGVILYRAMRKLRNKLETLEV